MKNRALILITLFALIGSSASLASEGNRLLVQAIQQNDVSTIQQTLQLRVNMDEAAPNGLYAIHVAAEAGAKDQILGLLLDKGANPDIKDRSGETALHIAVRANSFKKAKMLLDAHADSQIANRAGDLAIHLAVATRGSTAAEIAQLILTSDPSQVNRRDRRGYTPLMLAALRFAPSPETVQAILNAGADKGMTNLGRFTALDFAKGMLNYYQSRTAPGSKEVTELQQIVELLK